MKLATLSTHTGAVPVRIVDNSAYQLTADGESTRLQDLIARPDELHERSEKALTGKSIAFEPSQLLAPILSPRKILGIGLNYADHAKETGREPPKTQTWFSKQVSALNAPYGQVELPAVSSALDYEVELVVVIGQGGRHIPADRAFESIAGFCVGNDLSVRDWQRATPTMIMGKGFDTHAPIGPWIVTPDEIGDISSLRLKTHVNGELRQDGTAGDMIHSISAQIEHLSAAFTLEPGDLIFTGTPAGVGVASTPPNFLKDGDTVRVEIDRIGHLEHVVRQEIKVSRIGPSDL